jgi:hypothetical protein
VLAASATVYLGAAALRRPAAAWPLFFATVVVITAARLADDRFEPTWVVLGGAVALGVFGLLRGAARPGYGLPLQTLALLGFGAAAGAALVVNPELGAYLVAAGLLGHAAWDAYHHRVNRGVVRSMAEFCLGSAFTCSVAWVGEVVRCDVNHRTSMACKGSGVQIPSAPPAISPFHSGSERCCQQTTLARTDAVTARPLAQAITSGVRRRRRRWAWPCSPETRFP